MAAHKTEADQSAPLQIQNYSSRFRITAPDPELRLQIQNFGSRSRVCCSCPHRELEHSSAEETCRSAALPRMLHYCKATSKQAAAGKGLPWWGGHLWSQKIPAAKVDTTCVLSYQAMIECVCVCLTVSPVSQYQGIYSVGFAVLWRCGH